MWRVVHKVCDDSGEVWSRSDGRGLSVDEDAGRVESRWSRSPERWRSAPERTGMKVRSSHSCVNEREAGGEV